MNRMIYLIRHGEPDFGPAGPVCLGRMDLPLSEKGKEQAKVLAKYFSSIDVTTVYHSPLTRCRQTAELLSLGPRAVIAVNGLEEVDMGKWDGLAFEEIKLRYPDLYEHRGIDPDKIAPTDGESLEAAGNRFSISFYELIRASDGDIAVIAHAGVNKMLLGALLNLDGRQSVKLPQPYCCLNRLEWDGSRLNVISVGETVS